MPLKIIKKKWQSLKDFAKFNLTIKKTYDANSRVVKNDSTKMIHNLHQKVILFYPLIT